MNFLIILSLVVFCLAAKSTHSCIHDEIQKGVQVTQLSRSLGDGGIHQTAMEPLRIVFLKENLYDSNKICTANGEWRPTFRGSSRNCTANDVMTTEKLDIIVNTILPSVAEFFFRALAVNRRTSPLEVPQGTCLTNFIIPSTASSPGVSDADMVMIVTAGPTDGMTNVFGVYCTLSSDNRPLIGHINIGPRMIDDPEDVNTYIRIVVHEMMHALGFSKSYVRYRFPTPPLKDETRRGLTVDYFSLEPVVTKAREYFNCSTLTGPELESEGGSSMEHSHWKRRSHKDDIMAGVLDEAKISALTLAYFEATGVYEANYSVVEHLRWGRNAGCGFHDSKCNTVEGGLGREFCNDTRSMVCTYGNRGFGKCAVKTFQNNLPVEEQYFSGYPKMGGSEELMEYCPIVLPFTRSKCDKFIGWKNFTIFGEEYSPRSRCIVTSPNMWLSGLGNITYYPRRCMGVICSGVPTRVTIILGPNAIDCPADGSTAEIGLTPYGYDGTLTCPPPSAVCDVVVSTLESPLNSVGRSSAYDAKTTLMVTFLVTLVALFALN